MRPREDPREDPEALEQLQVPESEAADSKGEGKNLRSLDVHDQTEKTQWGKILENTFSRPQVQGSVIQENSVIMIFEALSRYFLV